MPKSISPREKREWLESYESGSSEAAIARKNGKDLRTVRKAIREVLEDRVATQARLNSASEAFAKHRDDLLLTVRRVGEAISPLPLRLELWQGPGETLLSPLDLPGLSVLGKDGRYDSVELAIDTYVDFRFHWTLLQEHLGNDKAFTMLDRWKLLLLDELNRRLALGLALIAELASSLKLTIIDERLEPGHIRRAAVLELYFDSLTEAAHEELLEPLAISPGQRGEFLVGRLSGGRFSGEAEQMIPELLDLPRRIAQQQQGKEFRKVRAVVAQVAQEARYAWLEIAASHYVGGLCRSCKRIRF